MSDPQAPPPEAGGPPPGYIPTGNAELADPTAELADQVIKVAAWATRWRIYRCQYANPLLNQLVEAVLENHIDRLLELQGKIARKDG